MLSTFRELIGLVRQSIGTRKALLLVLVALLLVPLILAISIAMLPFYLVGIIGLWTVSKLQGVGKRRDDPVFGLVTYEGYSSWHAERDLEALGGMVGISVAGPRATGPGPAQREQIRGIIARQHDIRRQVEESLYREYQAVVPAWRSEIERLHSPDLAAPLLEDLTVLTEPSQIWRYLSDGSMQIEDEPGSFFLSWNCTWDMEHGVTRAFVNWKLVEDEEG